MRKHGSKPNWQNSVIQYQQTDSAALYTGAGLTGQPQNVGGTVDRLCIGTPGAVVNTISLDAFASSYYALSFDIPIPNFTLWLGGDWVIRVNVGTQNATVTWNRCYLFRLNASGVSQGLIGSATNLAVVYTAPGVKSVKLRGEPQYMRAYGDRVSVVCCFTNQGTLPPANLTKNNNVVQAFGVIPSELIDSPFSGGN
jgi:hypothetical protein